MKPIFKAKIKLYINGGEKKSWNKPKKIEFIRLNQYTRYTRTVD